MRPQLKSEIMRVARISSVMKRQWQDPEYRQRITTVLRANAARRQGQKVTQQRSLSGIPGTRSSWYSMIARCQPSGVYGRRGIKVCERWKTYANFLADMGPRPQGCTIDRKDNGGDYTPQNCRWATHKVQATNRRRARVRL
jgi:hypothetical protein